MKEKVEPVVCSVAAGSVVPRRRESDESVCEDMFIGWSSKGRSSISGRRKQHPNDAASGDSALKLELPAWGLACEIDPCKVFSA